MAVLLSSSTDRACRPLSGNEARPVGGLDPDRDGMFLHVA
jgi:hypothetical protein